MFPLYPENVEAARSSRGEAITIISHYVGKLYKKTQPFVCLGVEGDEENFHGSSMCS